MLRPRSIRVTVGASQEASERFDIDYMANNTKTGLARRLLGLELCLESGNARRLMRENGIPLERLVSDRELNDKPSLD